jgi:gas vesicle protein
MIGRARTALKFFVYGLVVGLLFAPRSGEETRTRLFAWVNETVKGSIGGNG